MEWRSDSYHEGRSARRQTTAPTLKRKSTDKAPHYSTDQISSHQEKIIAATRNRRSPVTGIRMNWESGKSEDAPVPAVRQGGHRNHNRPGRPFSFARAQQKA